MSKKRIRIVVSFKDTKEDRELYKLICKHSDKSAFIKDTIRNNIDNKTTSKKTFKKINF